MFFIIENRGRTHDQFYLILTASCHDAQQAITSVCILPLPTANRGGGGYVGGGMVWDREGGYQTFPAVVSGLPGTLLWVHLGVAVAVRLEFGRGLGLELWLN